MLFQEIITGDKAIAVVEIKCPFPKERCLSVHYTLPDYYIPQCLAVTQEDNSQRNSTMFVTKAFNLSFMCFKFRVVLGSEISGKS
jgi:hypothetical protein